MHTKTKKKNRTPIMRSTLNNRSTTRESPTQNRLQPTQRGGGLNSIDIVVSKELFENVDEQTDEWRLESFVYY